MDKFGRERWAGAIDAYGKGLPDFLDKALGDMSSGGLEKSAETVPILYAKAADHLNALSRSLLALLVEAWEKGPHKNPRDDAEAETKFFTDAVPPVIATTEAAILAFVKKRQLDPSAAEKGRGYLKDMSQSMSKDVSDVLDKLWRASDAGLRSKEQQRDDWHRMIHRETRQLVWACLISAVAAGGLTTSFFMKKAREDSEQIEMMQMSLNSLRIHQGKLVLVMIKTIGQINREIKEVEAERDAAKEQIQKKFAEKIRQLKIARAKKGLPVIGASYDADHKKIDDEENLALQKAHAAAQEKIDELKAEKRKMK